MRKSYIQNVGILCLGKEERGTVQIFTGLREPKFSSFLLKLIHITNTRDKEEGKAGCTNILLNFCVACTGDIYITSDSCRSGFFCIFFAQGDSCQYYFAINTARSGNGLP